MASNLTPGELAAIAQALQPQFYGGGEAGGSWSYPSQATGINGRNYIAAPDAGWWGWDDVPAWDSGSAIANYNGRPYIRYDAQGRVVGGGTLSGITNSGFVDSWLPFVMVGAGFAAGIFGPGVAATAGSSETAATGAATFNAAADSQLANVAIEQAGGNALAGYTAAGIPSSVIIDGTVYTVGAGGALTAASTLSQAASAVKTAGTLATTLAGVTRAITGGARPGTQPPQTQPYTVTPDMQQASASNVGLGALVALGLGLLALKG